MDLSELPINQVLPGDCVEVLDSLPAQCADLVFADPPYNLQLQQDLYRPDRTRVDAVDEAWDQFDSFAAYDEFARRWLGACRRVLKDSGSIWVIGSYHHIYRTGAIMQDLGYWILNDIIWIKTNPMPNFRGVRFTNAHETLIWASHHKDARYTFNHYATKHLNDELQMRSDWLLPLCTGEERLQVEGRRAHPTQKPEALLYRIILACSNPGDLVLDPFFGSGTTGAVAKKLDRRWIGIEREPRYIELARRRIAAVEPASPEALTPASGDRRRREPRIPFGRLLECGLLQPGQALYFDRDPNRAARLQSSGLLALDGLEGSIHQVGTELLGGPPCNGWEHWYFEAGDGSLHLIDELRQQLRRAAQP